MKRQLLLGLICLVAFSTFAGNDPSLMGARGIALGRAFTGVKGSLWALSYNPAGIAFLDAPAVGVYSERRFGLKELSYGGAAFAMPFKDRHYVGAEVGSFGYSNYRETKASLAYATHFLGVLSVGTKVNFSNVNIPDLGSSTTAFVDIGLNYSLSKTLSIGASAYNVNQAKIRTVNGKQNIPTVLSAGISYTPSEKILLVADIQKDMTRPLSIRGGVEYFFIKNLCARIGMSSQPLSTNIGIGWQFKGINLDIAGSLHERLGFTPSLSLSYKFVKKTKIAE